MSKFWPWRGPCQILQKKVVACVNVSRPTLCVKISTRGRAPLCQIVKKGHHPCQILGRPTARVKVPAARGPRCQILPPCVKVKFRPAPGPLLSRSYVELHIPVGSRKLPLSEACAAQIGESGSATQGAYILCTGSAQIVCTHTPSASQPIRASLAEHRTLPRPRDKGADRVQL